jgi:hypothetical protein
VVGSEVFRYRHKEDPVTALTRLEHGNCTVCNTPVEVTIALATGAPLVDATGYSGLTNDGDDYACRDHYCPTCGNTHGDAATFDNCAFRGVPYIDTRPLCSRAEALATLAHYGMLDVAVSLRLPT